MENIMIGWGERDITPSQKINLFGHFAERITDKVRDPITVTALFAGTKTDYAVMVSCDLCIVPQDIIDRCRKEIKRRLPGIKEKKVFFSTTHTHDAPGVFSWFYPQVPEGVMSPEDYAVFFIDRASDAVTEAWKSRKEGSIGWAYGQAVVGRNRRAVYFDGAGKNTVSSGTILRGTSAMYGRTDVPEFSHIEGYEDHGVDMLFTWDSKDNLTGVVINIACTSQETEGLHEISADFWHETREALRKKFGKSLKVLPQCGAAGDQSSHLMFYKKAQKRMLELKGMTMRQEIGARIARAVEESLPLALKDKRTTVVVKHLAKKVALKRRVIGEKEIALVKKEYNELLKKGQKGSRGEKYARHIYLHRCREVFNRYELQKSEPEILTEVHAFRLGDIAFATNRFELYLDYGIRIKARSPFTQTFVVQLSGGGTYLPTERGLSGLGYSASPYDNIVGPEGGRQLVEKTLKMLSSVYL